jgi:hypothetical protein
VKFLNSRVAVVGTVWGVIDVILLVAPLYLYGTSLSNSGGRASLVSSPRFLFTGYTFGPLPVFPVGWFAIAVSFVLAFALADVRRAVKALVVSEILSFAISPLILISFPTALTSLSPDGIIAFFAFEAVIFFLLGMAGAVFGSFLGSLIEEEPGSFTLSLSRHRTFLLAGILILIVMVSFAAMQSWVIVQVQNAAAANSLKGPFQVANKTLNWNAGTQDVWANFTTYNWNYVGNGVIQIEWNSTANVSFHALLSSLTSQLEVTMRSSNCGSAVFCGGSYVTVDHILRQPTIAWFHQDACPSSGCPSGQVHYVVNWWQPSSG